MKKIYTILAAMALMSAGEAYAVPAYRGAIQYTQPDGSVMEFYRSGDENGHKMLDAEGHELIKDADGWLRRATAQQVALRAAATPSKPKYLFSGTAFPCVGEPHGLVVLAQFKDKKFSMTSPKDYYTRMLNKEGFSEYGATGSARDFFIANSSELFKPTFDVYGPVTLARNYSYYGANDLEGYDLHPEEVLIECLNSLDSSVDFSKYDLDGDGYIDNVFVIYAGYGEADCYDENVIWPHSADLLDYHLPQTYVYDGVILNRYGMTNEVDYTYKRPDGIGTFVHEFSHVLGLPDIYATTYTTAFTPGEYDTLDYGPYNNKGLTPPHYSVFERYCMGWLTPEPLTASGTYTLDPIHVGNKGYIICTERPDEFYLLENRQKQDYDKYIPGHGMLVWHIDFVQSVWDKNICNNKKSHQYIDIVEADNKQTDASQSGDTFPGTSGITSFTSSTSPALKSWSGKSLGVDITNIKEENGVISFYATVNNPYFTAVESVGEDIAEGEVEVYDLTGIKCGVFAPGEKINLPKGIYILKSGSDTKKIRL